MNMKDRTTALKGVSLQHRHFAAIAYTLRQCKPNDDGFDKWNQWRDTVQEFAAMCRSSNSRFDADRFFAACDF